MENSFINIIKKCVKPLGKLLSVLSIIFVCYTIYKLGFDFNSITNRGVFAAILIIGTLIKAATVFITGSAWTDWLSLLSNGVKFKRYDAIKAYTKANIGKYLPGNVMHYVERNLFASGLGISQKSVALSSVAEIICQLASALIMSLFMAHNYFIRAVAHIFGETKAVYIIISAAGTAIFAVLFLLRKKAKLFFESIDMQTLAKTLAITLIKYIITLWLFGIIMVILYCYMGGTPDISTANLIISGYVIAWVLGFVTPGASGGIGVRELIIILLLSPIMGEELTVTLSVIHRLITVVGDFISYFIVLAANIKTKAI